MEIYYTNKALMPRQKVSRSVKETTKWKYDCVNAVIATTKLKDTKRRRTISERKRNYDLFNNKIDEAHFRHITNPFNISREGANTFKLPATLQPYDILFPIFNVLFGEEHKRFFNPVVRVVNDSAIKEKEEMTKEAVLSALQEYLLRNVQPNPENPEEPPPTPEDVIKNAYKSIKDMREETANLFLQYYKKRYRLKDEFAKGWKDWLLCGEEFYSVEQIANEVSIRRVNPLQVYFFIPENTDSVEEASQILEQNYMTVNQLIDEFYEYLTPQQIDELEMYYANYFPGNEIINPMTIRTVESIYNFEGEEYALDRIPVFRVRWKSFRKVGNFYYIDPQTGEEQQILVDESWQWDRQDSTQRIEWFWISEYWEGIRIGADMYIDEMIRRRPQQFRTMDNLSKCKSGYVGRLCSAINSQSTSLMDRIVPWLYLYFILWYDTELALATNIGKIAVIDVSTIPDGWDVEKWFYYARAMRVGFVNSMNEGNKRMGINQNMSTLNKELNLEMGNYIQFNIQLLQEIERKIQNTAGVPPQRLGAISNQELVGNVERSLMQSSLVTEDLFRMHTLTKLDACSAILEVAKDVYKSGSKTLQYVTDDLQDILFQIDGDTFNNADYGVFVTDDMKDMEVLEAMKAHAKFALQNDQMAFYQLADIYTTESVSAVRSELKRYYESKQQQLQAQQQQQVEVQQQQIAAQQQMHAEDMELKRYMNDSTNETKIQVAQIGVFSRQQELDLNGDGIPDPVELAGQALKEREAQSKEFIERLKLQAEQIKLSSEKTLKQRELDIKTKEIASREKIASEKAQTALKVAKTNKNKYDKK
jgi:hypothetical protein